MSAFRASEAALAIAAAALLAGCASPPTATPAAAGSTAPTGSPTPASSSVVASTPAAFSPTSQATPGTTDASSTRKVTLALSEPCGIIQQAWADFHQAMNVDGTPAMNSAALDAYAAAFQKAEDALPADADAMARARFDNGAQAAPLWANALKEGNKQREKMFSDKPDGVLSWCMANGYPMKGVDG